MYYLNLNFLLQYNKNMLIILIYFYKMYGIYLYAYTQSKITQVRIGIRLG